MRRPAIPALWAGLLVSAVALSGEILDADRLVKALDDPDGQAREAAMRELEGLGEAAGPALLEAERSGSPEARWRAAALLDRIPWARPDFEERTRELVEVLKTTRDLEEGARAFAELRKAERKIRPLLAALFPEDPVPPGSVALSCEVEERPGDPGAVLRLTLSNKGERGIWINARGFYGTADGTPVLPLRSVRRTDPERERERGFRYNLLHLPPGGAYEVRVEVPLRPGEHAVSAAYDSAGGPWEPAFVRVRAATDPAADEEVFVPRASPLAASITLPPIRRAPPTASSKGAPVVLEAGVPAPPEGSPEKREMEVPLTVSGSGEEGEGRFVVTETWAVLLDAQGTVAGFFPCSGPPGPLLLANARNARTWKGRFVPDLPSGDYRLVVSCAGIHVTSGAAGAGGTTLTGMPRKTVVVSMPIPVTLR